MPDRFSDMDLVVRIVRAGGLAKAGRTIGLSPATVSERLKALETRLGVSLFTRSTRSLVLTEEGREYFETAQKVLEDVFELEDNLAQRTPLLTGQLRISAPSDLGRRHVATVVARFTAHHPQVRVVLCLTDRPVDLIEEGFDLAFRLAEPKDSRLKVRRLAGNYRVVCAAPAYFAERAPPKAPDDLAAHRIIAMIHGNAPVISWPFLRDGRSQTVIVNPILLSDDGDVVRRWALAGFGIVQKSVFDVAEDLAAGRLQVVLKDWEAPSAPLNLMIAPRTIESRRVRAFIENAAAYFAGLAR